MSGHLRFWFAAFLLVAGLSRPAFSNPLAELFGQAATVEAATPAPAKEECLSRPGKSAAEGQHWYYRLDSGRKCWFQAAVGTTPMAKNSVHRRVVKRAAAAEEDDTAWRKPKAVVDARAELMRSASAGEATPPALELKVADATPVTAVGAARLIPPAPDITRAESNRLRSDDPTPRHIDVETLLTAVPAGELVAGPAVPLATAEEGDDGSGWKANRLGVLLIGLGFVFLLSSSRTARGGVLAIWPVGRFSDRRIG